MPILAATNITHNYGDTRILHGCTIALEPGERVGMVGRNGAGKSTLFGVLTGRLKPDAGEVLVQKGARTAHLEQDPNMGDELTLREAAAQAFAHLASLHEEIEQVFHDMADVSGDELAKLMKRQESLERRIEAAGGYAVDHRIDAVLHGLGLDDRFFGVKVGDLSGGQRGRLALALALLAEPDVLLLDEPTNHLDIEGRLWLESFLRDEYRGAVLMISHDRYLLDAVVSRIAEVEQGRVIEYPGNYAAFRKLRAERREASRRAYDKEQTQFKREEAYIRKYKAGQRAKQARGRESRLDRAKEGSTLERPMELTTFRLRLPKAERSGDLVIQARGLSLSYDGDDGEKVLFRDLDVGITRGERWGIIGPNGAGKTTLVRCLLGEQEPDEGTVSLGSRLSIGYFRQTHEGIDPEKTLVRQLQDVVRRECPEQLLSEQAARDLAGAFLFSGREQDKEMGVLSGGERARVVMAGLMASAKNLLILDEPTNHLDIPSAERLEEALSLPEEDGDGAGFDGTLVVISHDRAFIDATCDRLLVLDGKGSVKVFLGNYSEWAEKTALMGGQSSSAVSGSKSSPKSGGRSGSGSGSKSGGGSGSAKAATSPPPSAAASTPAKAEVGSGVGSGPKVKSRFSWMRLEQVEARMTEVNQRIREIDAELGDVDVWRDVDRANGLTDERDGLKGELGELEAEWLRKAE